MPGSFRNFSLEAYSLASQLNKEPFDINSAVIAEAIDQEDLLTCQVVEEAAEVLGRPSVKEESR